MKHLLVVVTVVFLMISNFALARGRRVLTDQREIKKVLKYHPELTQELLFVLAQNPGTTISHAVVDYITVVRETSEREYTCEISTTLGLSNGETLSDKVEADKDCDLIFN
jgi:F0F1-type ATP synthase delta subunit